MNKTLSIGLAGFSFTIEEHAYIKLSDYLSALRNSLDADEAEEVMHDIEIRMVEIFRDSLGKREVINDDDVEKVIAQIGTPEAIEQQEEAYYSDSNTKKQNPFSGNKYSQKELFRDPEKAKLGGVCAGLAHYTGMEITWMRVIWVLLFFAMIPIPGSPLLVVLIYIILWAILPKAQSTSDFLKMKGKPVNFDTIKEESGKIVQFTNEAGQKVGEMYNESKPIINSAGSGIWNVFRFLIGGLLAFISFLFLMSSLFGFGIFANTDFSPIQSMDFYFDGGNMTYILSLMIVIAGLIPAILFGLLAAKLISPSTKLKNIGWVILGLFFILIGLSTYFGFNMAKKDLFLKGDKEDTEEISINTNSDTLYVDLKQVTIPQNFKGYEDDIYSDKKNVYEKDYSYVNVTRRVDVKTPYLIIKKEAKGYNLPLQVTVPVDISGNKISLPNFIKYPYDHRFRDYIINYELVVPQNTIVIPLKKEQMRFDGDLNANGTTDDEEDDDYDYNDHSQGISIEKNKITINGKTIEYDSRDSDSIIINGKKVSKDKADKVMDSLDLDFKKVKDVDIKIKDGKKEISIKTNK